MKNYCVKKEVDKQLEMALEQARHFNSLEETLQKSIVVAQEAADEVRRNSQKEAKLIVKEAEKMLIASSMRH